MNTLFITIIFYYIFVFKFSMNGFFLFLHFLIQLSFILSLLFSACSLGWQTAELPVNTKEGSQCVIPGLTSFSFSIHGTNSFPPDEYGKCIQHIWKELDWFFSPVSSITDSLETKPSESTVQVWIKLQAEDTEQLNLWFQLRLSEKIKLIVEICLQWHKSPVLFCSGFWCEITCYLHCG